jgi:hypothetical protein
MVCSRIIDTLGPVKMPGISALPVFGMVYLHYPAK